MNPVRVTSPPCCSAIPEQDKYSASLIAQLRNAYGKHVGDPAWTHFIRRLEALSPTFTEIWAAHDVAQPASHTKRFRHPTLGLITTKSTSFAVTAVEVRGNEVRCQVTGSVEPLLGVLAASGVHQLLSREPSLEELFLAHYGREQSARMATADV